LRSARTGEALIKWRVCSAATSADARPRGRRSR
jgi:hypothetical protein